MLTIVVILQGAALSKVGYATPFMAIGAALGVLSCGLFYTLGIDTSAGKWIGYQILCGFASGATFQTAMVVVQVNAKPEDMSSVTAMIFCEHLIFPTKERTSPKTNIRARLCLVFQMVGGSFTLAASQSAFNNRLISTLASTAPNISPETVLMTGATQIREAFTSAQVPAVVAAYMEGLKAVFAISMGTFGAAFLIALCAGWKKLYAQDLKTAGGLA